MGSNNIIDIFKGIIKPKDRSNPKFNPDLSGAHTYNKKKIFDGYNLFDGKLIDMSGKVVKEWKSSYLPLLSKGNYLAQEHYESKKWGKYTWSDKPIWEKTKDPIHHDLTITEKGIILTATREVKNYKGRDVEFDIILELDKNGKEISRWSTWKNLKHIQNFHKPLELDRPKHPLIRETSRRKEKSIWGGHYDYYRLNSIQEIPENTLSKKDKRFQKGNLLISFRHGSMIFILDKDTKKIVWSTTFNEIKDNLEGQHCPQMLSNGNILIFDNGRYRGWSRVIELEPVSKDIVWEYKKENFLSLSQGYAQRLPNGNTLITESEKGRVFEITPEKEIVWEYYHPEIQDENNSQHPESYGTRQWIYRMIRYPKGEIEKYLNK